MMCGNYYKLVGLEIDALEARIVEDRNIKDISDASHIITNEQKYEDTIWLLLPCQYKIK